MLSKNTRKIHVNTRKYSQIHVNTRKIHVNTRKILVNTRKILVNTHNCNNIVHITGRQAENFVLVMVQNYVIWSVFLQNTLKNYFLDFFFDENVYFPWGTRFPVLGTS